MALVRRGLIITIYITVSLLAGGVFVNAEIVGRAETLDIESINSEINSKKEVIKQLEETISVYRRNIEKMQLESTSLRNQLGILDNHIARLQAQINLTNERISQLELEMQSLKLSIKEKKDIIDRQQRIIAKMVQNVHSEQQKNYFEVMLTSNSFSDFYGQIQYLQSIYADLGRSVKGLRLAKEELESKKHEVESQKQILDKLKIELEEQKDSLDEQAGYKKKLLVDSNASETRYRTLLDSLKRQYQIIEGEVRNYEDEVRKRLNQQDKLQTNSNELMWPVPSRYITARFRDPDYPFRRVFEHSGMDIRASQGTPVHAAGSGYVARAKRCSSTSCYSYVLLIHTSNLSTLYGHLSGITVGDDQFVNKGDIIGYSGGTPGTVGAGPFVTGPHMHFETRLNGIPVDPINYLVQ